MFILLNKGGKQKPDVSTGGFLFLTLADKGEGRLKVPKIC